MTLFYHGTIDSFSSVDVSKSRGNKDFGKLNKEVLSSLKIK